MPQSFDPGYGLEPFATLCREYPGPEVYPPADFRLEWGPIFHRGRLDGSARALVIGQDPAEHEAITRRILVGMAGQRAQGFLRKLGLTKSYVLLNTYLYGVYGQGNANKHASSQAIGEYRNRWIDAVLEQGKIEAVIALGSLANKAWSAWRKARPSHPGRDLPFRHLTHPTMPDSVGGSDTAKVAVLTTTLLNNWNAGLEALRGVIQHTDVAPAAAGYGDGWATSDMQPIPATDLPPGLPAWMRGRDRWARRIGTSAALTRANLTISLPPSALAPIQPSVKRSLRVEGEVSARAAHGSDITALERRTGRCALHGTVVPMTPHGGALRNHVIYITEGVIEAVQPAGADPPAGFEAVRHLKTKGLIFPGLIDLHNHLAYDILPLWMVPRRFTNREQWSGLTAYHSLIGKPMSIVGEAPGRLAAICRYVETKALLGGTTTSQGIRLVNQGGISTFFRGLLRNVELPDDPELPAASARIGDVVAKELASFFTTLRKEKTCYLLHLSEGVDAAARSHFLDLRQPTGKWALTPTFAGIHCAGLKAADFKVLAKQGASMVWSPLSNLLLYGATADIAAAKNAGVRIGLGPDWSPSGSKNVLGELKVARVYNQANGSVFSDEELVAMATREAAAILKWQGKAGTIVPGAMADLLVVSGSATKPHGSLIEAAETDIRLVVIGGVFRYGLPELMRLGAAELEEIEVGGKKRALNLLPEPGSDSGPDPGAEQITLVEATKRLTDTLSHLRATNAQPHLRALARHVNNGWSLALDETEDHGLDMRPRVGLRGVAKSRGLTRPRAAKVVIPEAVALDGLTVADDKQFLKQLAKQPNLPAYLVPALRSLY